MNPGVEARLTASRVVGRVVREGAYLNVVLRALTDQMDAETGQHVRRLAYDAVRRLDWIDPAIGRAAGRPPADLDDPVLDVLRIAAAELIDSPPTPAVAVHTAVETVRETSRARAAGFVNAVARRLAEDPPGPGGDSLWERHAVPEWLADRLAAAWGFDEADAFLDASNRPAPRAVRVRPQGDPDLPGLTPVATIEGAALVAPGPLPEGCVVQDPASVAVGLAVAPRAGETVADLAAAPGGKTLHLLDQMGGKGRVVAVDRHPRRARDGARRVPEARWVVGDAIRPPLAGRRFDRVLLDAPCSGLGVLRRRPEIRHRISPADVDRLASAQRRMLASATDLLGPGGTLVYAVCTVVPEETIDVVAGEGFRAPEGLPGRPWGDGILLGPHMGPFDGMFIAITTR